METNNLTELLTAVAAAIRERDGTDELISPQDFAERILTLSNEYVDGELKLIYGETEPGSVLGGTWVEDDFPYGTFLMAAGSGGTAGQSGGSNSIQLTEDNLPNMYGYLVEKWGNTVKDGFGDNGKLMPASVLAEWGTMGRGWYDTYNGNEVYPAGISRGNDVPFDNRPMNRTVHVWRKVA